MSKTVNLLFSKDHEWVKVDGDVAYIGISDYAQNALGDIIYIELPMEGDSLEAGFPFAIVESVKSASDVISPVSGSVLEINAELEDAPHLVNEAPYDAWIVKTEAPAAEELAELMDEAAYNAYCETL